MDSLGLAKLLVRLAELCAALMALWWIHGQIPLAGEYLRRLSGFLASPLFVFLLCHVIVVFLMADSGKFSLRNRTKPNDDDVQGLGSDGKSDAVSEPTDEIVFEDKQVISESTSTTTIKAEEEESENEDEGDCSDLRHYRRWRSENFERENSGESGLRRSESEKCLDIVVFSGDGRTGPAENVPHSHDKLSDEDFNRTVEAFIAKQLKFRRHEHSPEVTRRLCASLATPMINS